CGSCHNPHDNSNGTFLRVTNSGSGLCLKCHIK
ncbi:MAG: cytochrome C, partial [Nitrospirae bacterium]|nr:cytochrome C [Nitrospirota bacterium]